MGQRAMWGVLDVSSAAIAMLAVGVYAARNLPSETFGTYAIFLSAVLLGAIVPFNLIFLPSLAESTQLPEPKRQGSFRPTLRTAWWVQILTAIAVGAVWFITPDGIPAFDRASLAITAAVVTTTQPVQLYGRQLLHYSDRSRAASAISVLRFAVVVAFLAGLGTTDTPTAMLPLGSLIVADSAAIAGILALTWQSPTVSTSFRSLVRRGQFLLPAAAIPVVAAFITSVTVAALAGPVALAQAEGARLIAQPIAVLAAGVLAVGSPRIISTVADRGLDRANRMVSLILLALAVGSVCYAVLVIPDQPWNLARWLVPVAYDLNGLVTISLVAVFVVSAAMPLHPILIGARSEKVIAVRQIPGSVTQVAVGFTAQATVAFARPLGVLIGGVLTWSLLARAARTRLSNRNQSAPPDAP